MMLFDNREAKCILPSVLDPDSLSVLTNCAATPGDALDCESSVCAVTDCAVTDCDGPDGGTYPSEGTYLFELPVFVGSTCAKVDSLRKVID